MTRVKDQAPSKAATQLVPLLTELVKFPTVATNPAAIRASLEWVKRQVAHLPLHVTEFEQGGVPSLVLTTRPTKRPKVLLLGHIDVVPGPPEMYTLKQRNGRLLGRGVFDMKYALVLYLQILLNLEGRLADYDLGVMITGDEEMGGRNGAGALVAAGWAADVIINFDALGNWEIERGAKGVIWLKAHSHGAEGHGSRPWGYKNAIVQLMAFLQELRGHFDTEPCGDHEHAHSTMSIGLFNGGQAFNQIAGHATAEVDIRVAAGVDVKDVQAMIDDVASHYSGVNCEYVLTDPSLVADPNNDHTRLFELLVTKVAGVKPSFILSHGGSDSRYFEQLAKTFITTGPPGGGAHAEGEWLDLKGFEQTHRILAEFVVQTAKVS
jgi:acetylornithine deacetylase/succinyl-diaminopimelate desuccinylase-like protein